MHPMGNSHAEHQLEQLAHRFDHWRQTRTSLAEPMPQTLWEQAVSFTTMLPRSRVARQLRWSGRALKHRCVAQHTAASARLASTTDAAASPTALDFVEVTAPSAWPLLSSRTEIELQRVDGARLRIHSREPQRPLAALVRTFLETR